MDLKSTDQSNIRQSAQASSQSVDQSGIQQPDNILCMYLKRYKFLY